MPKNMEQQAHQRFQEKLKELLALAKKKKNVLVYRTKTLGSSVCVAGNTTRKGVRLAHYFADENEQNNEENPGAVFMTVKKELSSGIGRKPGETKTKEGTTVWYWRLSKTKQVSMRYKKDGAFEVWFEYFSN